jgi:hypothetical protein
MAKNPHAMTELRALLSVREPAYRQASQMVDTSRLSVEEAVDEIAAAT